MKTGKFLLFVLAGFGLLMSCTKVDDTLGEILNDRKKSPTLITVPFKADFTVYDKSDYSDNSCGEMPLRFITMEGEGTINHMGKITTRMTFCCNLATGDYYNTVGSFVSSNGDELFFEIPIGKVIPNEESNSDYYQTRFNDRMYFTGGTGRFENASGWAMTNAYVHDVPEEWHADFFSEGILTIRKK